MQWKERPIYWEIWVFKKNPIQQLTINWWIDHLHLYFNASLLVFFSRKFVETSVLSHQVKVKWSVGAIEARWGLLSWGQAAVGGCQTAEQGGRSNPHSWTVATATVCSPAAMLSPRTHLLSSASAPKPFEFHLRWSKGFICLVVRAATSTSSRWKLPVPAWARLGFLE